MSLTGQERRHEPLELIPKGEISAGRRITKERQRTWISRPEVVDQERRLFLKKAARWAGGFLFASGLGAHSFARRKRSSGSLTKIGLLASLAKAEKTAVYDRGQNPPDERPKGKKRGRLRRFFFWMGRVFLRAARWSWRFVRGRRRRAEAAPE